MEIKWLIRNLEVIKYNLTHQPDTDFIAINTLNETIDVLHRIKETELSLSFPIIANIPKNEMAKIAKKEFACQIADMFKENLVIKDCGINEKTKVYEYKTQVAIVRGSTNE